MTSATCPACGVTVLPGYAKCPKCRAPLPYGSGSRLAAGGTALDDNKFPVVPLVLVALAIAGGIAFFALRKGKPAAAPLAPIATSAGQVLAPPTQPTPPGAPIAQETAPIARTPTAGPTATQLETTLKKLHLWSTVEVIADHVDVRSGACEDAQLSAAVDAAKPAFKAAGLTRVRCLEQSGRVVFQRPL